MKRYATMLLCLFAAACAVMIAGHASFVGSYGGWSWGFRYLIPIVPVMLFFAPPLFARLGPWLSAAIVSLSVALALIGAYNPWPPAYEQESDQDPVAALVSNPVAGNLSAWLHERFPDRSLASRLGSWLLGRDVAARNRGAPVAFLIGPEGGISDDERTMLLDHPKGHSITLGPRILRAETAAFAALGAWQALIL